MTSPAIPEIDVTEAARQIKAGEAWMLDVREDDEWTAGHAPDARHIALGDLDPATIPNDRPIIVMCRSGNRSGKATTALLAAGIQTTNIAGGMKAWSAAGLPVLTDDNSPGVVA